MRYLKSFILLGALCLAGTAAASEYVFKSGFYWQGDVPYTRTAVWHPGSSYFYAGCWYQNPGYYTYEYAKAAVYTPEVPKPPAVNPDWRAEIVKAARGAQEDDTYLKALAATFGARGAFNPSLSGYSSYANVVSGNTLYGSSYNAVREAYGALDLNAALQNYARAVQNAQQLGGQAATDLGDITGGIVSGAQRAAEIRAKGDAAERVFRALEGPPVTRTEQRTFNFSAPGVTSPAQPDAVMPQAADVPVFDDVAFKAQVLGPQCLKCHGSKDPDGKLDLTNYAALPADVKERVWARILSDDPKRRMPKDAPPLSPAHKRAFLTH